MAGLPFQLELTHPVFLAGLLTLPLLVWFYRHSLVDFERWQRKISLLVRSIVLLLLVLALTQPLLSNRTNDRFVVFALDRSLSVGKEGREKIDQYLDQALRETNGAQTAFLDFGAAPGRLRAERAPPSGAIMDDKATNLAAALEVAASSVPPFYVARIVLLTDGNQTAGDALETAQNLEKIKVFTVPLAPRGDPEVQVSAVNVPAQVQQGEPFFVEVVVDANHDDEGTIEVFRGPQKVISEKRKLHAGENRFRFQQTITTDRLAEFSAQARGFQDTLLDNNTETGLVFAAGKPRVLLIENNPKAARPLVAALNEEDIQVDVRPPQGMPTTLADLQNYELLALSNVPATALTARQMELARTYVQDLGGGFIMLGGDQSFGLGGYYKSVLEEILPVRSDFEKEKQKPSLAMALVIDKSGSMGGEKIEMAKDAARAAVELLGPNDKVGVIAFEGETFWISEMHSASDKPFVIDRIASLEAGGGTSMYPAMEEAYGALENTPAKLKHVIILTDGISEPGDFEGVTARMAGAKITVSTVAVGGDSDAALLEFIAKAGNGRFYLAEEPSSIPQIFARETMTASKSALNEQPFVPQVVRPTPALADLDFNAAPMLLGYVVTRPKPTCELILTSETGDPLLAWWRYGLGTAVAFTSDAKTRWAAEWVSWPGFSRFWAQVVRYAMRRSEAKGFYVAVDRQGRTARVTLDAADPNGGFLNGAETQLTLIDPRLDRQTIKLAQSAPGRYVGEFETPHGGAYHLDLSAKFSGQLAQRQTRGLTVGYPDELRLKPTNRALLESIAQATGGSFDPAPAAVFAPDDRTAPRITPLWPYLLMLAALLLLLDIALRRIDLQSPRRTIKRMKPAADLQKQEQTA